MDRVLQYIIILISTIYKIYNLGNHNNTIYNNKYCLAARIAN